MDLKVLILEDDPSAQKSLQEALSRFGISNIKIVDNVQDFKFTFSIENFDLVILDCLLPGGVSGLDVVQSMNNKTGYFLWVVSAVISQNSIPKDILPKIDLFLRKPIQDKLIEEGLQKIQNKKDEEIDKEGVLSAFYKPSFSEKDLELFLTKHKVFKGHELALLICLCSLSQRTGCVEIKNFVESETVILHFSKGNLHRIQSADKKSYFGVLAAAYGEVSAGLVKKLLDKEGSEEPIGEKLVRLSYISPHTLPLILKEQLKIRLSQLINFNMSYKVQLKVSKDSISSPKELNISLEKIRSFLLEILWSKTNQKWLESLLCSKENVILNVVKNGDEPNIGRMFSQKSTALLKLIDGCKTLTEVKDQAVVNLGWKLNETLFLIYGLLTTKVIYIDNNKEEKKSQADIERKVLQFHKLMETQDYFELLGLPRNAVSSEIKDRLLSFSKIFHPDRHAQSSLKAVCNEILGHLNQVKDILLDENERELYLQKRDKKSGEDFLQIFAQYNKAIEYLNRNRFQEALVLLKEIKDEGALPLDVQLYYAWAFIKSMGCLDNKENCKKTNIKRAGELKNILNIISKVPVEVRYTPLHYFVRALYSGAIGDLSVAQQHLNKSLSMDDQFFPARIELARYKSQEKKSKMARFFKTG